MIVNSYEFRLYQWLKNYYLEIVKIKALSVIISPLRVHYESSLKPLTEG